MTAAKWNQIVDSCEQALDKPPGEREAFLDSTRVRDPNLHADVQMMLHSLESAREEGFLEEPAWTLSIDPGQAENTTGMRIGPYKVLREIPGGGQGKVYLAARADGEFQQEVVIKLPREGLEQGETARFRHERQILADLKHENIARLLDGGTHIDRRPYLVMEYVEGNSLRQLLKERGSLPSSEVVGITKQICAALALAHKHGIVHRDIKPGNIMVAERDGGLLVKMLDFGLAILKQPGLMTNRNLTAGIVGSVTYMSPEQAKGKPRDQIDSRSDIYSLGMVVYEMLTGQPAFADEEPLVVLNKHLGEQPVPPSQRRPDLDIPPAIEQAVLRSLAKDPRARQQSIEQFASDLEGNNPIPSRRAAWPLVLATLVLLGIGSVAVWRSLTASPALVPRPGSTNQVPAAGDHSEPAESPLTSLTLSVHLKTKSGAPIRVSPERPFHSGDSIRIAITPSQTGYLYLVQQGSSGLANIIFPDKRIAEGNNHVTAGREIVIPASDWFKFDNKAGTETICILFAVQRGEELFAPIEQAVARGGENPTVDQAVLDKIERYATDSNSTGMTPSADGTSVLVKSKGLVVATLRLLHTSP